MIRWITTEIGTGPYQGRSLDLDVDIIDVRDLLDRSGNNLDTIRSHISNGLLALEEGRRVVLCCDHGISRSNAIAAALVSRRLRVGFDEALVQVLAATGNPEIQLEVLTAVRAALSLSRTASIRDAARVLVTGSSGGLGAEVVASAPPGLEIFAPDRAELDLMQGAAPIDLYLRQHRIGRVMHFAHPRVVNINLSLGQALVMLRNVLDACVANGVALTYPSTWHVFSGYGQFNLIASEATPRKPATCLGDTKFLCEDLIDCYVDRHALAATLVRSGPVLGGRAAPHFFRAICRKAARGEPIVTHCYQNGLPALDLLAIRDYTTAAWGLARANEVGTFHLGSGHLITTRRIAELVIAAVGSQSHVHARDLESDTCRVRMDSRKLSQRLGWHAAIAPELAIAEYSNHIIRQN